MVQVKNIEIFGTVFLAGCISAHLLLPHTGTAVHSLLSATFFVLAATSIFLCRRTLTPPPLLLYSLIFLCAAICILRGHSCGITEVGNSPSGAFAFFSSAIDGLGFRNSEAAALAKALLLGDRRGLSTETVQQFRQSGASHILALSGLHMGMVYGVISLCLKVLGNSQAASFLRSSASVLFCLLYCLMVGSGPSVSRAMIFVGLREYGKLSLRSTDLRHLLWASFVLQVCIAPQDFSSTGFQMSYLAVAGITYIFPILKNFYPEGGLKHSPLKKIWESAAMSISCQATTWPLARLRFGSTASCFILTNLICLPLTGIIIPATLTLTLFSACGIVWEPAVRLCEKLLEALLFSIRAISLI